MLPSVKSVESGASAGWASALFGSAVAAALVAAVLSFVGALDRVEKREAEAAEDRATSLDKTLQRAESVVTAMRDTFVFNLEMAESGNYSHPFVTNLHDVGPGAEGLDSIFAIEPVEYNVFSLARLKINGTLTGKGRVATLGIRRRDEVNAALALSPLLGHAMRRVSDAVWAYFLSSKEILYLTPSVPATTFSFRPSLYQKPFWTEATPKSNPGRRTVVSSIYEDGAGKGLMATVSLPIWHKGEFRGITAVDIGLGTLNAALLRGKSVGESLLVDENGLIAASRADFTPNTSAKVPKALLDDAYTELADADRSYWTYPVQSGELWLVHAASRNDLRLAAMRLAAPAWALLAFVVLLVYLLLRLRRAMGVTRSLAQRDSLTGAYNRRAFEAMARPILATCERQSGTAAVMMIDADHFKRVNDHHGHGVGDEVLVGIADIVSAVIRQADLFGRYGGEEFFVLAPFASAADGTRLAERIRTRVQEARFAEVQLQVTLSIGVGLWAPGMSLKDALADADAALYRAKESGRNRVELAATRTAAEMSGEEQPVATT